MYHCSLTLVQAECEAKLVTVAAVATSIGASGRAEICGSAAELPLPLCTGGAGVIISGPMPTACWSRSGTRYTPLVPPS